MARDERWAPHHLANVAFYKIVILRRDFLPESGTERYTVLLQKGAANEIRY